MRLPEREDSLNTVLKSPNSNVYNWIFAHILHAKSINVNWFAVVTDLWVMWIPASYITVPSVAIYVTEFQYNIYIYRKSAKIHVTPCKSTIYKFTVFLGLSGFPGFPNQQFMIANRRFKDLFVRYILDLYKTRSITIHNGHISTNQRSNITSCILGIADHLKVCNSM